MHISQEEFDKIISEGKMFKLSDDMFYGTVDDFRNCFFDNVDYQSVISFANINGVEVLEYTEEEHANYLKEFKLNA